MSSVGIIVLNHNTKIDTLLARWEPAVKYLKDNSIAVDFVFVEGGTDDMSIIEHNRDLCLRKHVKRRWVPVSGKETRSKARNKGAEHAEGEYFLFVDGDCYPDAIAPFEMLRYAAPNLVVQGVIENQIKNPETRKTVEWLGDHRVPWTDYAGRPFRIVDDLWMMHEQAFVLHRDLFWSVGGFDASWAVTGFCFEGVDLYTRVFARHFSPLGIATKAIFTHQWHPKDPEGHKAYLNLDKFKERLRSETFKDLLWHPHIQKKLSVLEGAAHDIR